MGSNLGKRWLVSATVTPQANEALAAFSPIMRQVLFNRGYATDATARAYLRAEANFDPSPFQMTGIMTTVERVRYALDHNEPIAIYGDYDVDGVTATALLVQALRALGGNVRGYIPNRFDEGYGLNKEALSALQADGVKLVISVDCGIRSPDETSHARAIGLDLIISDHHQPAEGDLPPAFAVINPKQVGDLYPDKDLAGVGVAYKIVQALLDSIGTTEEGFHADDLLDLVALGTVADLAPLVGENRILVRKGLQKLCETKRQGLFSLAAVSDLPLSRITATSIGFTLGPRLNAAGRLESALAAFDLLTTTDVKIAGDLAQQLNVQNHQRQEITRKIQADAEAIALADDPEADLFFAVHPDFNAGVVGLAAARLVETYYRPAVVGQISAETTRCSCRSIPEFHITKALDQCKDLLIRHGGHAAAAGFTVRNENLEALKARLKSLAMEQLRDRDLRQTLTADTEVPLSDLKPELLKHLEYLQPTGYGNPEAVFVSRDVRITNSRTVGAESKHLKLVVTDGRVTFDAIGFRLGHLRSELPLRVDVLYTFESNEFNGRSYLQLNLKDVKPAGLPLLAGVQE
ncbi:MAG: single-stranded-DNA-specific exonuclease RecJ [Chloroflexi bacterium]|nr:single-stranded-DNA-specific exonuclease RecJ [Chloroflexota bacterium]